MHDEIVVTHGSVSTFAGGADGDVAPIRDISGSNTSIGFATAVAIDVQSDELIVGSSSPNAILRFTRTANGNVFPIYGFVPADDAPPIPIYVDRIRDLILVSKCGD